ncbi:uncharacterized protein [Brachyistius frenatus]|uniref:uncharacterized protein n=1 Tax=Brachyistius frenatus TaxID=100188 RepID=UPI0037E8DC82
MSQLSLRSMSQQSVFSDLEMDSPSPTFLESRPSSLESLSSNRLLTDSPVLDFVQPVFGSPETTFGRRSSSPESTCSDIEYIVISQGSWVHDNRCFSPGSGASGDECQVLSPDSPIPDYRPAVRERLIVNIGYRSSSPESIDSDVEYALSECLMSMSFSVEDRADSPESVESDLQERLLSAESIPEYKPMSPVALMSIGNVRSVSPKSTESLDEHKRLSSDSPLPWFTQHVLETATVETHYGSLSPESLLSDIDWDLACISSFDTEVPNKRTLSTLSVRSDDECKPLTPDSPIPDFTKTFIEDVMTMRSISPVEFSDSDDLSQSSVPFCAEERSASPDSDTDTTLAPKSSINELKAPAVTEATIDSTALSTTMKPFSSEESAIMVAEYNLVYDAEIWKLISQVHDPQYAGETFSSKTGFMQFIGSTTESERSVTDEQDNKVEDKREPYATAILPRSEVTHQFTTKDTAIDDYVNAQLISDIPISESPPPMTEHISSSGTTPYRQIKYTFQIPGPEDQTEGYNDWVVLSVSDIEDHNLWYSPESLIDYRPMSPNSVMVTEARAPSPESVASVNEFRPLSPDSPLPEFTVALPECVKFLRSTSASPEASASDIDSMTLDLEFDFVEGRSSSPESGLSVGQNEKHRPLSSQSLPEYRPMSLESAMYRVDKRASSPESMCEFNENRSLSPDSPIPQFSVSLEEYTTTRGSLSPESLSSDSECELMVTSWRAADTNRPSSPESISSVNEFRQLLPDSPVPEFMRILSSYYTTPVDRSSSPVSLSSDSEFVALQIGCWIDDSPRPLSPEAFESDEELDFCYNDIEMLLSNSELLNHGASPVMPDHSSSLPNKGPMAASPSLIQTCEKQPGKEDFRPEMKESESEGLSYKEWHGSEAGLCSTLQMTVGEEDFRKDLSVKPSTVKDVKRKEERILNDSAGELKSKTDSQRAPPETSGQTQFQTDDEVQSKLFSATTSTQDASKIGVLFSGDKPKTLVPLQLPDWNSYTTHRAVTPFLPTHEETSCVESDVPHSECELSPKEAQSSELFSPMSAQFLVPPDYEAVFSGQQTLRVSECSKASLSPESPLFSESTSAQDVNQPTIKTESESVDDFEFSPDFRRVVSEFEKAVSEFESGVPLKEPSKGPDSPEHSDSDLEFFDCSQAFSDFSEPEDLNQKHEIAYSYHISEPPSPIPGSTPDIGFLQGSAQYSSQPFLRVEDYKRFSSGSESLGEYAYDSEASRECQTRSGLPVCEELPSRDQAGYYDDDDFLGRVRG